MRAYDSATLAALARGDIAARALVWIVARDRITGDPEAAGWWTGEQAQSFTIGGAARLYHAAGGLIDVAPVVAEVGLSVRMHSITLSPLSPEVAQAVRGYDVRHAPVEVHRVFFDIDKGVPVSAPHRVVKGWVDRLPDETAAVGGESRLMLTVATSTRSLTRKLAGMKSDASQRLRGGDRLYRWSDVSRAVDVPWGE